MYLLAILPILSALSGLSFAQSLDPSDVSQGDKSQWCTQQQSSCPLLCLQYPGNDASTLSNDCDDETLVWSCVCANGQTPNASEYSQTIPYFECTEINNQCVDNCPRSDSQCQSDCRANNPCGAKDPTPVNSSAVSSTMSKTATGSATTATDDSSSETAFQTLGADSSDETAAGGDGSDAYGNTSGAGQLALDAGRVGGMAVVLGGVFAGVILVL